MVYFSLTNSSKVHIVSQPLINQNGFEPQSSLVNVNIMGQWPDNFLFMTNWAQLGSKSSHPIDNKNLSNLLQAATPLRNYVNLHPTSGTLESSMDSINKSKFSISLPLIDILPSSPLYFFLCRIALNLPCNTTFWFSLSNASHKSFLPSEEQGAYTFTITLGSNSFF